MATQQEINNMSKRDRLWFELTKAYDDQIKQSDKSFEQSYSEAGRNILSRGMQRSSYGTQTLANINQEKINAQESIMEAKNAAYAAGLRQIEQEEEQQRQFELQLAFQREQAAQSQANWEREYALKQAAATAGGGSSGTGGNPGTNPPPSTTDDNATITQVINALSAGMRSGSSSAAQAALKKNLVQQRKTMDRL